MIYEKLYIVILNYNRWKDTIEWCFKTRLFKLSSYYCR